MRRLSITSRLVLLHTLMMTVVAAVVLGLLFSISSGEILANVQSRLRERVNESFDDIEVVNGSLRFDNDFLEISDGIYLSAYQPPSTELLYGRIPYGFDSGLDFAEDTLRQIASGSTRYYVYDMTVPLPQDQSVMVRGIVSIDQAQSEFQFALRAAMILFPLLILLTALCGYLLSRRAMRPVTRTIAAVQDIRASRDLSKRVGLGAGRDEIYELARTFDELLAEVESVIRREKQFTSDVAHELRTPVTTMNMALEDLLSRDDLSEEVRDDLQMLRRKNELMSRMIGKLLMLSRADQGRLPVRRETTNLSELCGAVCAEFKELAAKDKAQTLVSRIQPGIWMEADETLMLQLLGNVLENAIRYTPQGGQIEVELSADDRQIVIGVRDNGVGISAADKERIWDRFYKAESSRHGESSGLGLSIVRWIVEVHGGQAQVESEPGQGSVFRFLFLTDSNNTERPRRSETTHRQKKS